VYSLPEGLQEVFEYQVSLSQASVHCLASYCPHLSTGRGSAVDYQQVPCKADVRAGKVVAMGHLSKRIKASAGEQVNAGKPVLISDPVIDVSNTA
jgi:hypothetical protein